MTDMKKGLIFVLFALVSIVSYSQISWNAKVGMNMSNFTGDADTDMRVGFNVGVGMEYQFTDMWSIQPSLMFTQKGAKLGDIKANPMYLELPVMAAARITTKQTTCSSRASFRRVGPKSGNALLLIAANAKQAPILKPTNISR